MYVASVHGFNASDFCENITHFKASIDLVTQYFLYFFTLAFTFTPNFTKQTSLLTYILSRTPRFGFLEVHLISWKKYEETESFSALTGISYPFWFLSSMRCFCYYFNICTRPLHVLTSRCVCNIKYYIKFCCVTGL